MVIRTASEADIDLLAGLEQQCFDDPWSPEMIRDSFHTGLDTWLLLTEVLEEPEKEPEEETGKEAGETAAAYTGAIAGYCVFRIIAGEGELFRIGVRPDLRGLGYGKKLMDGLVNNSRKNGVTAVTLEVRESNLAARNLYKIYGFEETCIRKGYYVKPAEAAVIMWNRGI